MYVPVVYSYRVNWPLAVQLQDLLADSSPVCPPHPGGRLDYWHLPSSNHLWCGQACSLHMYVCRQRRHTKYYMANRQLHFIVYYGYRLLTCVLVCLTGHRLPLKRCGETLCPESWQWSGPHSSSQLPGAPQSREWGPADTATVWN